VLFIATATDSSASNLLARACANDIKTFCGAVIPGAGALKECVQFHFSELSPDCQVAIIRVAYVGRTCRADVEPFCSNVTPGRGAVAECMKAHAFQISGACREATAAPASDVVPFTLDNGAMFVSAAIGGRPVTMQVDTGANVCTIPESLANELIASGQARELPRSSSELADGRVHTFRHISVSMLVLGNHWRKDIPMTVMPGGTPLLSLAVLLLSGKGKFTIDAVHRQIVFG
jgi:hypothetical protein